MTPPFIRNLPAAHAYTAAWKKVIQADRENLDIRFKKDWIQDDLTPKQARTDFLTALHNRINARGDRSPARRDDSSDYLTRARRDQRRLIDIRNRIRVYQFETREVRRRFSHLLSKYDD